MKKLLTTVLLAAITLVASAQTPTVALNEYIARGATKAFARIKITNNGVAIRQSGICWSSETAEPTISDSKSNLYFSNNGAIYRLNDLQPATKYYIRAYVTTTAGATYYSDADFFYTLPKGTATWSYDNGADAAANARINAAVGACVDEYWNNLANIIGLHLSVHYGAGTPTADCSYGGWMRVGPNPSYQRTGTIMHETLHGLGVGTTAIWTAADSPLRAGAGTGQWLGDRATNLVRFWDNNPTAVVSGDAMHVWPYGINGANEDNGTDQLYTITTLLAQALGEDGIPCISSRVLGSPHYSLKHKEGVKYYIKSESYNTATHFLYENVSHKLRYAKKSAAEAAADDSYAWYITFDPAKQCYQFQNAKTGNYITYSPGVGGFTCEATAGNIQLNRSRCNVKNADGIDMGSYRGYWMGDYSVNLVMKYDLADKNTTSINFSNDAKAQRFVILTGDEAAQFEDDVFTAARTSFNTLKEKILAVAATPHIEVEEGADAEFQTAMATYIATAEAATTATEITNLNDKMKTALRTLCRKTCVKSLDNPYDLTLFIVNPDFDSNTDGWTVTGGTWGEKEVESFQKALTVSQKLPMLTKGTYELRMQGFQRPGAYGTVYEDFTKGTNNVDATLSLAYSSTKSETLIHNIMDDRAPSSLHSGDVKMADNTYVPNNMASAQAHFQKDYYDNSVQYYLSTTAQMTVTLKASANTGSGCWTIFDNFRLYYYGGLTMDEIKKKIEEQPTVTPGDADGDGTITMADANLVVNYFLGDKPDKFIFEAADIDHDGDITMADANAIVNMFLGQ